MRSEKEKEKKIKMVEVWKNKAGYSVFTFITTQLEAVATESKVLS